MPQLRTRAIVLVMRYSSELTNLMERAAGVGTSGNHEIQVLTHLYGAGPCSRRELIVLTGMSRSGVGHLVERLAALGLVENYMEPRDHRLVVTKLTRSGRRRVDRMTTAFGDYFGSPNALVEELVELLRPPASFHHPVRALSPNPLDTVARVADLGARLTRQIDAEIGISDTRQCHALATLADRGDTRPRELADLLELTSGGTTYLVDQLESHGVVERRYGAVPNDRRAVLISLTSCGWAASELFTEVVFEHADELAEVLAAAHTPG